MSEVSSAPAAEAVTPTPADAAPVTPAAPVEPAEQPAETFDRAYVEKLRAENAENRTKARDAETAAQAKIAAALEALGIKPDTDPAEAAKQAATERDNAAAAAREATLNLAVYKAASKAGADADALLDSNSFRNAIGEVDPSDVAAVNTAIENAVKANPRFKLAQAASASGSDFTGGSGEGAITQDRFNSMSPTEKNDLFNTQPTLYRALSGR